LNWVTTMGISMCYTSTRAVAPGEADAIREAAAVACEGRSWLSSEPVCFVPGLQDGKLVGDSKPNFSPHPDDARQAAESGLPDGGPREVIEILCGLSRDYKVDWEIGHDFGSLGFIRGGVAEPHLAELIDAFGDVLGDWDELIGL
jgi:hypothetical protein